MIKEKQLEWLFIPIGAVYVILLGLFSQFVADDAYIVGNYARRFFQTGSISFNNGDAINALTSPLQLFIETILYGLTGNPVDAYRFVSIGFVLIATWALLQIVPSLPARLVVVTSVLLTPQLITWTMGGLDTVLVLVWMSLLIVLCYHPAAFAPQRLYGVMVVAGLAFITRYDSVLMSVPLVLYAIYRVRDSKHTLLAAAIGAVVPVLWLIYAHTTFGSIFPTSYYAKEPRTEWSAQARYWYGRATLYILYHMGSMPAVWLGAFVVGITAALRLDQVVPLVRGHLARTWWIYVVAPGLVIYGLTAANTHMMFTFRLLVAFTTPILAVLVADLVQHSPVFQAPIQTKWLPTAFAAMLMGTIALQAGHGFAFLTYDLEGLVATYETGRESLLDHTEIVTTGRDMAIAIDDHWATLADKPSDEPYVFTGLGGIVPYHLPDAYTFEALASWRAECPSTLAALRNYVTGANYITTLRYDVEIRPDFTYFYASPPGFLWDDMELLYEVPVTIAGNNIHDQYMGVLYNPNPLVAEKLPKRVTDPCDPNIWPAYGALNRWAGG